MSVEQEPLKCPRCDSLDTKFCYYNNYSTTQPRHFCKNCKRYWTAGGSLRNVPVGGGLRKNKKSKQTKQTGGGVGGGGISPSSNNSAAEEHGERGNRPLTRSASVSHALANPSSDGYSHYDTTSSVPPSLPLTISPSSSAEDETLAKSRRDSVFAYASPVNLKYFDTASDAYYANSYSLPLPLRSHGDPLYPYNYPLSVGDASSLHQQQQADEIYGGFKRLRGGMATDPSSSLQAEPSEISASSQQELAGKSRMYGHGYGSSMNQSSREASANDVHHHHHHHHQQHQQQQQQQQEQLWYQQGLMGCPPPPTTETNTNTTMAHGDLLQASTAAAAEYPFEKRRAEEEEDEGLGNVVNVRYPYDWEQVSEVLFGGGPDFFQMPGF